MAFVNERLTQQQREDFLKRKIRRPTSDNFACPIFRTIDTGRNMCLWHLGNLGRDDFNDHKFLGGLFFDDDIAEYKALLRKNCCAKTPFALQSDMQI